MSNAIKIAETLGPEYKGAGFALAAIAGGQVVAPAYLDDVLPEFDQATANIEAVQAVLADPRVKGKAWEMTLFGEPSIGICVDWRFVPI